MRVVKPISVNDLTLTSSNIPEPDESIGEVEWSAGTYTLGTRRISSDTHRIYEVVADPSTDDDPIDGVKANPQTWVDVGPTNRWAMFDTVNSSQSTIDTELVVEITPGAVINSVAGFGIEDALTVQVVMDDPIDGEVFNRLIELTDNSSATDWYYYYFAPVIRASEFIIFDLPSYPNATLTITVNGNNIKFGNFVAGNQLTLGIANFGTGVQLLDYSRREVDDFGNTVVRQGRTSKLVNYNVTIDRNRVSYVFNTLSGLTSIPCVWVGTDDETDETLVFGYYRDFQNNINTPTITDATLTIEGLV